MFNGGYDWTDNPLITYRPPDGGFAGDTGTGGIADTGGDIVIEPKPPTPPPTHTYTWEVLKDGSVVASGSSDNSSTAAQDARNACMEIEAESLRIVVKDDTGATILDATVPGKTTPTEPDAPQEVRKYGYTLNSDDNSYSSGGGLTYGSASEALTAAQQDAKDHNLTGYTIKIRSWVPGTVGERTESENHYGDPIGTKKTRWSYEMTSDTGYAVNKGGFTTESAALSAAQAEALAQGLVKYTIRTYSQEDGGPIVEGHITSYDNGTVTPPGPPTPPGPGDVNFDDFAGMAASILVCVAIVILGYHFVKGAL